MGRGVVFWLVSFVFCREAVLGGRTGHGTPAEIKTMSKSKGRLTNVGLAVTLPVRFFNLLWIEPDDGRQDSVG